MNDCPDEARLLDYLDGRLTTDEHTVLAHHLDGCESCRELVGALSTGDRKTSNQRPPSGADERTRRVDPLIGAQVGEYLIEERIGAGGMGMVYRARQPVIGKSVAVKVIRPDLIDSASQLGRLVDEARAANVVGHRNIIDIFSFGTLPGGEQYFVMEYLVGTPLNQYLAREGRRPARETLELLVELVSALSAAHAAGVVHRDLKPSNLFLVQEPDGKRLLKVLDFGIAKLASSDRPKTRPGSIIGTPEYMSPEQVRGEAAGPETDLYAVGLIAFEMLAGRRPFRGSPTEVMQQHLQVEPPTVASLAPDVPLPLDALVRRLLGKSPSSRGRTEQVLESLRLLEKQLPSSSSDDSTEPQGAPLRATEPGVEATTRRGSPPGVRRVAVAAAFSALALFGVAVGKLAFAPEPVGVKPVEHAEPVAPKAVEPVAVEPAAPDPIEPEPVHKPKPVDVKARRAELVQQIDALRKGTTDPTAQLLLGDAEKRARAAATVDDLRRVEKQLDAVRAGYLKKR